MIQSARLTLRPMQPQDAQLLFGYRSDPRVAEYQGWVPKDLETARAFCQAQSQQTPNQPDTWMQLSLCLRQGPMIGDLGLHFLEDGEQVEFGISLAPAHQGQGYANEAMLAVFDWLFSTLGKHRIFCSVDPRNLPSMAMAKALGMRQEAHFVKSLRFKGAWVDDVVFGLLAQEWPLPKAQGEQTG